MIGPHALEVRGIVVRYGAFEAVSDVDVVVDDGEIVALVGPNGAGKTSLFNAIAGAVRTTGGTVRLDGVAIDGLAPHQRARAGIGRTFERPQLFGRLTVRENLEAARHRRSRHERRRGADAMLAAIGLGDYAEVPCAALPYGTQRLAEIARALCTEPRVLLLDEPSAGLDSTETAELAEMVRRVPDALGTPVLVIEHDMDVVTSISDYVYVLDRGVVLAAGDASAVRSDAAVRAAYLGTGHVA